MANFDIASFNLLNWANSVVDLYDSTPKIVEIIQKDVNGDLVTTQVQNLGYMKENLQSILTNAANSNTYTYYVDQTNGDDTNAGTSDSPFKSLDKAISVLKPYSINNIIIEGDYTLSDTSNNYKYLPINNTNVSIDVKGKLSVPYKQVNSTNVLAYQFNVSNSVFSLTINSNNTGSLEIGTSGDDSNSSYNKYYGTSLILSNGSRNLINVTFKNYTDDNSIFKVGNSANLLYLSKDTFCELMFCCSGTNRESIMGTDSAVIINSAKCFLRCTYNQLGWKDTNGNSKTLQDYLIGFSKDTNGVPQNYMVTPTNLI